MNYLEEIDKLNLSELVIETPLDLAPKLSKKLNCEIYLKREDLQPVFSFKLRGAFNKISKLTEEERDKGVVCASAGNHAQGVGLSCKYYGCPAVIFMPVTTPNIKFKAVKDLGAEVRLVGDSYQESDTAARKFAEENNKVYVHPFDDIDVIMGQGTIAKEIYRQLSFHPDYIFVCVGGGGLLAGIAAYSKQISPNTKIIGVEPVDAACMQAAFDAGTPVPLNTVGTFADGAAVKLAGTLTYQIASTMTDQMITSDTDELCSAIKAVFEDTRVILEPAGALAVAGATKYLTDNNITDKKVVCILSGANLNFSRLRHITERAELGEGKEIILGITIPEKPGSFRNFIHLLGSKNVTEFNYRYESSKSANIFVGIEVDSLEERKELLSLFNCDGFICTDFTDNELAKLHIRHLVGGKNNNVENERIIRFEFPERKGALMKFLMSMNPKWNISLFHYRSHGSDVGRVLAGIQVEQKENEEFGRFLNELGFSYIDETNNLITKMFL